MLIPNIWSIYLKLVWLCPQADISFPIAPPLKPTQPPVPPDSWSNAPGRHTLPPASVFPRGKWGRCASPGPVLK